MSTQPGDEFIALQSALAGEYSLDREVGRGGMGIVYLAREVHLARPVAIKVLPPDLAADPASREAFLREAQIVGRLNHPNIVPVYAAGERNGFVFMAMAFVEGVSLGERIRTRGPLLPGQAARVLREVAWALAYAHGANIVHRDVSAENILLERGTERAIVMDFGIASAMQTSAVGDDGQVVGNAHYVSPEQVAGEPVDARSDLYSLGVVGYYALTGRLPFDGESTSEVITQHLTATPPAITSIASSVPPRLAAAVERCLHKERLRRYRTAESFAEAIDLAFEHAREIPAPLRSWINQGQVELPARLALIGIGTMAGLTAALTFSRTTLFFYPFAGMTLLSYVPYAQRLRRVLTEGFTTDDLHSSLREHQLVRAEEIEYERRQVPQWRSRLMRITFGISAGAVVVTAYGAYQLSVAADMLWRIQMHGKPIHFGQLALERGLMDSRLQDLELLGLLPALFIATIVGVPLAGEFIRHRLPVRLAAAGISFWKGKWGKRLAKLALLGRTPLARPALGMPVLTEVALGRATDNLFNALPKAQRRALASLPAIVHDLEEKATRLRGSVMAIDDQLAAFDSGSSIADAGRERIAGELRDARTETAARLVATVSAIEGIRLDLLRLQMGAGGIESVTASIDAARRVGDDLRFVAAAQTEIDALLRPVQEPHSLADAGDSENDTPVGGVSAASV